MNVWAERFQCMGIEVLILLVGALCIAAIVMGLWMVAKGVHAGWKLMPYQAQEKGENILGYGVMVVIACAVLFVIGELLFTIFQAICVYLGH